MSDADVKDKKNVSENMKKPAKRKKKARPEPVKKPVSEINPAGIKQTVSEGNAESAESPETVIMAVPAGESETVPEPVPEPEIARISEPETETVSEKTSETKKEEKANDWSHERRLIKEKRKKIRLTILLLLLLAVCVGGVFFLWQRMQGQNTDNLNQTYNVLKEFTTPMLSGSHQRLGTFAEDMVVLDDNNVRLESSQMNGSQKGLLFDMSGKRVLFAQGVYDKVYPASITKIMTAMVALKYGNLSDTVYITPENLDLEAGSQVCGFRSGDQLTLEQLMNCLLVYSGNDAAGAIAEHVGGTTENFVKLMNQYARELGCTGTHFTNPHGLQDEEHFTTVYDIYLMLREAMNYPKFTEMTQQGSYTVNFTRYDGTLMSTYLPATDHYLTGEANAPRSVTVLGGKTGTTSLAGNCLALLCQDAYGKPFCSIVMGAKEKEDLYVQMNALLQNVNK